MPSAVQMGIWIHDMVRRNGWELYVIFGTELIDMYVKCGRVEGGWIVFSYMNEKNVFTWNVVIKGLALAKSGEEANLWFNRMEFNGVRADEVTLVTVLSACSHSGLVDKGQLIFSMLVDGKYGFCPNDKHYACMVDLLARADRFQEPFEIMRCTPFEPTKAIIGSKSQWNFEFSVFIAGKLVEMVPDNTAYYVQLSNLLSIYLAGKKA
ncbi:pentatricopeptide repeat-containing protein At5g04780, mitochondrial-like [Vicia villosa]|uniref:pentatricopeptide repeat-containing protein At5g04780, mitochondrial-like n=1 Tax=Vicia villosa TaxID=3911 RepID=UPI00273B786A|nr:pentatricopeptide repeat-containing protein At5g04780, mitochondrial-like [Vicia villosa]